MTEWKDGVRVVDCKHPLGVYVGAFERCPACLAPSAGLIASGAHVTEHAARDDDDLYPSAESYFEARVPFDTVQVIADGATPEHARGELAREILLAVERAEASVRTEEARVATPTHEKPAPATVREIASAFRLELGRHYARSEAAYLSHIRGRLEREGMPIERVRVIRDHGVHLTLDKISVEIDAMAEWPLEALNEACDTLIRLWRVAALNAGYPTQAELHASRCPFPPPPTTWEEVATARPGLETLEHWVAEHGWKTDSTDDWQCFYPPFSPHDHAASRSAFEVCDDGFRRYDLVSGGWPQYTPEVRS